jgi:hypothetical protein
MAIHRGIAAALVALGAVLAAVWLRVSGPDGIGFLPACLFHRLTGFACPGCGMTRAIQALMKGRLAEAMTFHPVGVAMLPVIGGMVVVFLASWVRGERSLPFPHIRGRVAWWSLGAVLAFWIFRNLPLWPFTCLGPP